MKKQRNLFCLQLAGVLTVVMLTCFASVCPADVNPNCDLAGAGLDSEWNCCLYSDGAPVPEENIIYDPEDACSYSVIRGGLKQTQTLRVRQYSWCGGLCNGSEYQQALNDSRACLDTFIAADPDKRQGADVPCLPLPPKIFDNTIVRYLYDNGPVAWLPSLHFDLDLIAGTTTYAKYDSGSYEILTFAVKKEFTCVDPTIDSDGDGHNDCVDNCPFEYNPDQTPCQSGFKSGSDPDGDGIGACLDNCPNVQCSDLTDCDGDGIGDVCDCNLKLKPDKTIVPPGEEVVIIDGGCAGNRVPKFHLSWEVKTDDGLELNKVESGDKLTLKALSGKGYATITCTSDHYPGCVDTTQIYFGCPTCDAGGACQASPGGGTATCGSIDARMYLGRDRNGLSAGEIVLKADFASPQLSTPAALKVYVNGDSWATYSSGATPAQVVSREVCANIEVVDAYKYNVRFYRVDPASAKWQTAHRYGSQYTLESEPLISAWTVENPDMSPTVYNRLKITQDKGGAVKEYNYVWDQATAAWSLAEGNDRVVSKSKTTDAYGHLVETETVADGSGNVSSVTRTTWKTISCNGSPKRVEIEKTVDPDGLALTTVTDYYEDGEPNCTAANAGLIQSMVFADGSWVKYEYDPVTRMVSKEARSWLDQPISAPESSVRVINYRYTPVAGNDAYVDGYTEYDLRPRRIIETVAGQEVSRQYYVYLRNQSTDEVTEIHETATAPGAAYANAANRRAVTVTYLPGAGPEAGRIKERTNPDGTKESYTYGAGAYDPVSGEFTYDGGTDLITTVTNGLAADPYVVYYKNTREETIGNYKGDILAQKTYVITPGMGMEAYILLSWSKMTYDDAGRIIRTDYSNGASATAAWDCCHKTGETDIYGIDTDYTGYDGIGRLTRVVKNGVATGYTYDASGRRLSETVSAGGLTLASHNTYDTAGRPDTATDAAGLLTDYVYTSPTITTVIRPGGATEVSATYLDGQIKSITGTGVAPRYFTYGVNADGSKWTRVATGSESSVRYEKTTYDMAGNVIKVEKPGPGGTTETTVNTYSTAGRLMSTAVPGQAVTRYAYDALGNMTASGLDVNASTALETASSDRIQKTDTSYVQEGSDWWQVTTNAIYAAANSATATTTGIQKTRVTGLGNGLIDETIAIDINGNQTTSRTIVDPLTKTLTRTVDYPDSSINEVTTTVSGLVTSQTSKTGVTTTFSYDALGRRIGITDPRTGTAVTHYNSLGQVDYVQDPAGNRTDYTYDPATGRQAAASNAKGETTRFAYTITGQLAQKWGDAVEPVMFVYDDYGQMTQMHMFRNGAGWDGAAWPTDPGDADITTWAYDAATGLLVSKTDDAGKATAYTYNAAGRLLTRAWARQSGSLVTTYGYDPATGDLLSVNYSDATPDVAYTYTRAGQMNTVTDAVGARTFGYNSKLQPTTESITGLYSKTITRAYDTTTDPGRATGFSLSGYSVGYGYDTTGRMNALTWNTGAGSKNATYAYVTDSDLIDSLSMGSLITNYAYEPQRNLKTRVRHTFNNANIVQYDYTYNTIAQRDRIDLTPDLPDTATPEAGAFTYTPDNLNQYDAINRKGTVDNPVYDDDGNMITAVIPTDAGTQTARQLTWDGENRLIAVAPATPTQGSKKIECAYDYMSRRVKKMISTYSSGSWLLTSEYLFLYDGWNLIQELDGTGVVQKAYVWGLDLSQSLQGAGGIGGLLAMAEGGNTFLYCHDANGNVGRVVNAADGSVAAAYEYAAFGSLNHKSGSGGMEDKNPFRFSTKYFDAESGLYYYGYRYYEPGMGRWLSRDPLGDIAFRNAQAQILGAPAFAKMVRSKLLGSKEGLVDESLEGEVDLIAIFLPSIETGLYRFAGNHPVSLIDILGLLEYSVLAGNYPTPSRYSTVPTHPSSIWKLVGGMVQLNAEGGSWGNLPNSCAIRMSHALNSSGVMIQSRKGVTSSGKNPPKWWYFFRIADIKGFIAQHFGKAKTFNKDEFKNNCKKGIVVLNVPWSDATGHADLWDGAHMIDGHDDYIDMATSIEFWELEDKR